MKKCNRSKHTYEGTKGFLNVRTRGLFGNIGQYPWSWIRIRISQFGSVSITAKSMQNHANPDPQQSLHKIPVFRIRVLVRTSQLSVTSKFKIRIQILNSMN
jgi:hypothetical protein